MIAQVGAIGSKDSKTGVARTKVIGDFLEYLNKIDPGLSPIFGVIVLTQ